MTLEGFRIFPCRETGIQYVGNLSAEIFLGRKLNVNTQGALNQKDFVKRSCSVRNRGSVGTSGSLLDCVKKKSFC